MGELYIQYEYWFAAFQLVMAMLGMGATLTTRDFADIVREPRAVLLGLFIQLALVPLTAFVFMQAFGVVGGLALGLALIASIPGGTTSNIFAFFARGNSALSISLTGLTTLACLLTTPLIFTTLARDGLPGEFVMPTGQVVVEIGLTLLLPLGLGMWYLYLFPVQAPTVSKWCIRASLFGILMIVVGSISAGRLDLDAFGLHNTLLVAGFALALWLVGATVPRLFRLARADATAIEFEVIVRNTNLGVLLKASLFPAAAGAAGTLGDTVLFTVLLFGGVQLLAAPFLIRWHSRRAMASNA